MRSLCVSNFGGGWRWGICEPGDLFPWEWSTPYATEQEARVAGESTLGAP